MEKEITIKLPLYEQAEATAKRHNQTVEQWAESVIKACLLRNALAWRVPKK